MPNIPFLQSIGVCKQQLENDKSIGLGRILLPALLLHGSYDFSIMLFNFLLVLGEKNNNDDDQQEEMSRLSIFYGVCTFLGSVFFVNTALMYYYKQSKEQEARLDQLDAARNFVCAKKGGQQQQPAGKGKPLD